MKYFKKTFLLTNLLNIFLIQASNKLEQEFNLIPIEIIQNEDTESLKKIINTVDINGVYNSGYHYGYTALQLACSKGKSSIVNFLLKNNADVNKRSVKSEMTSLHLATLHGHLDIVETLLDYNANINSQNFLGNTPLINALQYIGNEDKLEIVKILLLRGADVELKNRFGETFISYINRTDFPVCKELNSQLKEIYEKYLEAKKSGELDKLRSNVLNVIPISFIKNGDVVALQKIINHININGVYATGFFKGRTALMAACRLGKARIVECLLKNGADVNLTTDTTALNVAALYEYPDIVYILLDYKANIDAKCFLGNTPLMSAIGILDNCSNTEEIVKILISRGANPNIKNERGENFTDYMNKTRFIQNERWVARLMRVKAVYQECLQIKKKLLFESIENGKVKASIEILQNYPELINAKSEIGEIPINVAILFEQYELIKQLFENPNIKIKPDLNCPEWNPIEYALELSRPYCDPKRATYRLIYRYLEKKKVTKD